MAQLPGGDWVIQQIDGEVILYHRDTEEEVVRFDPGDANAAARAQAGIHNTVALDDEQKSFAHFWCGYFYAHARGVS